MTDFEIRVNAGIEWLNEHGPTEWWDLIDLTTLDLNSPARCVLGQVFAADCDTYGYNNGYEYIFNKYVNDDGDLRMVDFWHLGFSDVTPRDYELLTEQWARDIESLQMLVSA